MKKRKVLFLVNHDIVIYNFRKELVERLLDDGYEVYISSPYGERIDDLIDMGCHYIEVNINRHGINIIQELKLLRYYKRIMKEINPDVVLTYTIKPNIYGGMAAQSLGIPYIANITGLGTAVENRGIMQRISTLLYKRAFKNIQTIFFQNKENRQFFKKHNIAVDKHRIIPGSGVNLQEFALQNYPKNEAEISFLFVGRIMKEKGIEELIDAAKVIKDIHKNISFHAVGFYEQNYAKRAKTLDKMGVIKFHGYQNNIKKYLKKSNAVILPSYHEGMANVLLEAAATGRPIIASAIPGCRETFDEGITGFGFSPKNVKSLVEAIEKFINLPHSEKELMGKLGRKKIETQFNRDVVINSYVSEINKIISNQQCNN